jgi:hypothetical protein
LGFAPFRKGRLGGGTDKQLQVSSTHVSQLIEQTAQEHLDRGVIHNDKAVAIVVDARALDSVLLLQPREHRFRKRALHAERRYA